MVLFELVTPGVVSLLFKPSMFPEIYAVIANAYDPAFGVLEVGPDTANKLEVEEYIELKTASKEEGLFFNSFSKTVVLRVS